MGVRRGPGGPPHEGVTRKYSLVVEGDSGGYSAYVPELSSILVTGRSVEELTARAREAILIYWGGLRALREVEVELPEDRSGATPIRRRD